MANSCTWNVICYNICIYIYRIAISYIGIHNVNTWCVHGCSGNGTAILVDFLAVFGLENHFAQLWFLSKLQNWEKNGIVFKKKCQFAYTSSLLGVTIFCPLTSRGWSYQIHMTWFLNRVVRRIIVPSFTKIFQVVAVQERFEEI